MDFSTIYKDLTNKFIDINYYLGICNIELNNSVEAIDNFNMCTKYNDKFTDGYYYKGIIYSKLKKHKKALDYFKKALKLNNKNELYQKALKDEENKINKKFKKIEIGSINLEDKEVSATFFNNSVFDKIGISFIISEYLSLFKLKDMFIS